MDFYRKTNLTENTDTPNENEKVYIAYPRFHWAWYLLFVPSFALLVYVPTQYIEEISRDNMEDIICGAFTIAFIVYICAAVLLNNIFSVKIVISRKGLKIYLPDFKQKPRVDFRWDAVDCVKLTSFGQLYFRFKKRVPYFSLNNNPRFTTLNFYFLRLPGFLDDLASLAPPDLISERIINKLRKLHGRKERRRRALTLAYLLLLGTLTILIINKVSPIFCNLIGERHYWYWFALFSLYCIFIGVIRPDRLCILITSTFLLFFLPFMLALFKHIADSDFTFPFTIPLFLYVWGLGVIAALLVYCILRLLLKGDRELLCAGGALAALVLFSIPGIYELNKSRAPSFINYCDLPMFSSWTPDSKEFVLLPNTQDAKSEILWYSRNGALLHSKAINKTMFTIAVGNDGAAFREYVKQENGLSHHNLWHFSKNDESLKKIMSADHITFALTSNCLSPDGNRACFLATVNEEINGYVLNLTDGALTKIKAGPFDPNAFTVIWRRDGSLRWLEGERGELEKDRYTDKRNKGTPFAIYHADGPEAKAVKLFEDTVSWRNRKISPYFDSIFVERIIEGDKITGELALIHIRENNAVSVIPFEDAENILWARDGHTAYEITSDYSINNIDLRSGARTPVTFDLRFSSPFQSSVSPDQKYLASGKYPFSPLRTGKFEFYNTQTGKIFWLRRNLFSVWLRVLWSPDGKQVLTEKLVFDGHAGVYLLDIE